VFTCEVPEVSEELTISVLCVVLESSRCKKCEGGESRDGVHQPTEPLGACECGKIQRMACEACDTALDACCDTALDASDAQPWCEWVYIYILYLCVCVCACICIYICICMYICIHVYTKHT